jgi:choline dehydrogenase-like flavoprotein
MPLARIASILADSDIARLRFMARKSYELLAASGAERIYENYSSWDWFVATHVFGTCRMGDDPASSVVDAFGRSHRWRNLWIADASVFPSSGGGEAPSLTIQALALRTAERMAGN